MHLAAVSVKSTASSHLRCSAQPAEPGSHQPKCSKPVPSVDKLSARGQRSRICTPPTVLCTTLCGTQRHLALATREAGLSYTASHILNMTDTTQPTTPPETVCVPTTLQLRSDMHTCASLPITLTARPWDHAAVNSGLDFWPSTVAEPMNMEYLPMNGSHIHEQWMSP